MDFATMRLFVQERFARQPRVCCAAVGMCSLLLVFMIFFLRPEDSELFATPLDAAQTTEVDAHLAQWGIPHTITEGSIRVKAYQRNELLLRLALVGLPHPHIATSEETLAKLNALTPDAVFQAQARAGNAGDLAIALRGIDGVADASVVIAPAVMQAFSDQPEVGASAAVRLSLRSGMTLTPVAIEGVRTFIASGVPGLTREHVTILDDHGAALGGSAMHDDADLARTSLQSAFDEAFGVGTTIVRVHIRYDVSERSEREIQRLPVGGGAIKNDSSDERLNEKQRKYEHSEHHDEHGTIVREEVTQSKQGRPVAMAVAVLIDERAHLDPDHLRVLAMAGAGLDLLHGDSLAVEVVPFRHPLVPHEDLQNGLKGAAEIGALLATLFLLLRKVFGKKFLRKTQWVEGKQQSEQRARELHRLLQREPAYMAAAVLGRLPAEISADVLEWYPVDERSEIVARMAKPVAPYLGDWEGVLGSLARSASVENSFKLDRKSPHRPRC